MRTHPHLTLPLLLALAGCAAPEAADPDAGSLRDSLAGGSGSTVTNRLTGSDNGLELRKWLVLDDAQRIAAAMASHGAGPVLDEQRTAQLERNGLRFVRVPLEDVDPLLDDLGGALIDVHGWHGQMVRWGAVHELDLPRQPLPLAVDGRVQRFEGGRLALLARCWTLPTEDGPRLYLELVPDHRSTPGPTDLRRLLGQRAAPGQRFASLALDVQLEEGFAYVLTSEDPEVSWMDGGAAGEPPAAAQDDPVGPAVGPEAAAPITLGRHLLWSPTPPAARGMLLFVPRIPDGLYPSAGAADLARGGTR